MTGATRAIGPYDIVGTLGHGGSGFVLSAVHREQGSVAAIKVPKDDRFELRMRLRREIGLLQRLQRSKIAGVVQILEHDSEARMPWYAMELVQGQSLSTWRSKLWQEQDGGRTLATTATGGDTLDLHDHLRTLTPTEEVARALDARLQLPRAIVAAGQLQRVLQLSLRLTETLAQLHSEGFVHGDVTPRNVILSDESDPILVDFGAALVMLPGATPGGALWTGLEHGTPGYMAPECICGDGIDARSDLYSLGCILYELLTGSAAFAGQRVEDVVRQQLADQFVPVSTRVEHVSRELEQLVHGLLSRNPLQRPCRSDEVRGALCEHLLHKPARLRPLGSHPILYRSRVHGRPDALRALTDALEDALSGQGGLAVVSGELGLGKTRLLREVARLARSRGARVVTSHAEPVLTLRPEASVSGVSFQLFTAFVEGVALDLEASTAEGRRELSQLSSLLPLATSAPEQPSPERANPEELRGLAMQSLLSLLERASRPSGLVLLLDDAERSDEVSLAFLRRYAKALKLTNILIVAATSDTAAVPKVGLSEWAKLHLRLSPLNVAETRSMLRELLGTSTLPDGLFELIQQQAAGNPFFVTEYVRAAMTRGLLRRDSGRWLFSGSAVADAPAIELPDSIEGLLQLRTARLSVPVKGALVAACLLGHEFDATTFRAVTQTGAESPELLEELVVEGILRATEKGLYRFANDKLRESLARLLPPPQRQAHHRRIASFLEQHGQLAPRERDALLGYHWAHAGESARAVDFLEVAARAASSQQTWQRAAELFRIAIQHCTRLDTIEATPSRLAALQEDCADALLKQAQHREARDCLQAALNLHMGQLARARLLRKLASSHCTGHDYASAAEASAHAQRELEQVPSDQRSPDEWREWTQIRLGRFDQLYFSGRLGSELDALVEDLAPLIEAHGSVEQACAYYFMSASHAFLRSRYAFDPRALTLAEGGVRAAESGTAYQRAFARFIHGGALLLGSRQQCELALACFERASQYATRAGDATLLSRIRTYEAIAWLRQGDVEKTCAAARAALEAAEAADLMPYVAAAQMCQGWVAWKRSELPAAAQLLQAARATWKAHPHKFPFNNLAIFPLLDLASSKDAFELAEQLLTELPLGLPALPANLSEAIHCALEKIREGAAREACHALNAVLTLARDAALV